MVSLMFLLLIWVYRQLAIYLISTLCKVHGLTLRWSVHKDLLSSNLTGIAGDFDQSSCGMGHHFIFQETTTLK